MSRALSPRTSDGNGETIGHDSGREIVTILEKNPKRRPE